MDESFTEAVLEVVEQIPSGSVATFGLIAERLGRGGARQVGRVMSLEGHGVPWWRVVRANGTLPPHLIVDAQHHWRDEGTPVRNGRVVVVEALAPDF
ncbi:MGMT family protein [Aeromicrobium duanguangcaii]|uniref:MGMT family protein n=1 Tax=Aeromicrobium duanguangcaii TaxID=2968086 RepID=UPI0020179FC0|nr:MGMT family protein [Aeromicrobium duanguangcaii]MCL3838859.1 MGMT family protein [Aeromicrobium duanguangcaii]